MRLFTTVAGLRSSLALRQPGETVGFVPTMGALHSGHLSLIKRALSENDVVVVSVFVNPLQFSPQEDYGQYPQQLEADAQLCRKLGVDFLFAPKPEEMGILATPGEQLTTMVIPPKNMISELCASQRPAHFPGVATVVTKLLQVVQPHIAYFGEKDAQQLAIVRRLVADLCMPVEIRGCPIVREISGLAYSSRNKYLSEREKQQATVLYRSLQKAEATWQGGEVNASKLIEIVRQELATIPEARVEYVQVVHPDTLVPLKIVETQGLVAIAVWFRSTRLIDNLILRQRRPIIAIDGPAGAGKSTITRNLAEALGLIYLDTGAMYRAVTWLVMESKVDLADQGAIAELLNDLHLQLIPTSQKQPDGRVIINGSDVTSAIRTPEVTENVSRVSALACVRQKLVTLQKGFGIQGGLVAEGRDIGTNVFPHAELKIFLTASVEERSQRRWRELQNQGVNVSLDQLAQEIQARDNFDSQRKISPLRQAPDAVVINTDNLSINQVTAKIIELYHHTVDSV